MHEIISIQRDNSGSVCHGMVWTGRSKADVQRLPAKVHLCGYLYAGQSLGMQETVWDLRVGEYGRPVSRVVSNTRSMHFILGLLCAMMCNATNFY